MNKIRITAAEALNNSNKANKIDDIFNYIYDKIKLESTKDYNNYSAEICLGKVSHFVITIGVNRYLNDKASQILNILRKNGFICTINLDSKKEQAILHIKWSCIQAHAV